ncbi:glycosyltransferase family 2 protein [Inhella sp.]|uniref:glycosyltransferase family 2 protein n=1 Tax=Inhella sp. TaxID=1921806 RepID=UPI0035B08171
MANDAPALPRWSVVIPLHNKQEFIGATLRSACHQAGGSDVEVIVIDDGSTDESAARVSEVGDKRIRLIQQPNAGVAAARNRGIQEASGEWVVFLDADDILHPQALDAYREMAERFPQAQLLGGKDVRIDSAALSASALPPLPKPLPVDLVPNFPDLFVRRGMPFSSSSVAIRRQFLISHGLSFPEGESMGEDLDLWLRATERGELACTPAGIVSYRVGLPTSLMGSYRGLELLPVWRRLRARATSGDVPQPLRASSLRLVAEMEITLSRRLAKAGQRASAWRHLWAARSACTGHRWWVTLAALAAGSKWLLLKLR